MKSPYLIVLVNILLIFSSLLAGCALFESHSDTDDEDPVAVAAHQAQRMSPDEAAAFGETEMNRRETIHRAIESRQIVLGMRASDVLEVWGEPRDIEIAGEKYLGNQKWVYYNGLSSRWSLGDSRTVFFEGGQVVGWQTAP